MAALSPERPPQARRRSGIPSVTWAPLAIGITTAAAVGAVIAWFPLF